MTDKLTAERLAAIEAWAVSQPNDDIGVHVLALVAAARERDVKAAALAIAGDQLRMRNEALEAAEKERDELAVSLKGVIAERDHFRDGIVKAEQDSRELRAKVAELQRERGKQTQQLVEDAHAKGRVDDRRDVVAWLRELGAKPQAGPVAAELGGGIERGEHVRGT